MLQETNVAGHPNYSVCNQNLTRPMGSLFLIDIFHSEIQFLGMGRQRNLKIINRKSIDCSGPGFPQCGY